MSQWKNREEYAKWKAEKLKQTISSPSNPDIIEESGDNLKSKNKPRKLTKIELFGLVLTVILIIVYIVNTPDKTETFNEIPRITKETKGMAINVIKNYPLVVDVAIKQKGRDISLVLIVDRAVSKQKAKELGDNFVRLVKSFSKDKIPGKKIGRGIYNYLVGVYYPDEVKLVIGAKVYTAEQITWQ